MFSLKVSHAQCNCLVFSFHMISVLYFLFNPCFTYSPNDAFVGVGPASLYRPASERGTFSCAIREEYV